MCGIRLIGGACTEVGANGVVMIVARMHIWRGEPVCGIRIFGGPFVKVGVAGVVLLVFVQISRKTLLRCGGG